MNRQQLIANIRRKRSFLCVGLDTDLKKIPAHLLDAEDPIFDFNKAIIDATAPTQMRVVAPVIGLLRVLWRERMAGL